MRPIHQKLDFELTSLSFTWFWAVCPKRGPLPGASPTVWGKEKLNNIGNNCKTNNNYYKIKNNNNNINGINTTPWWALHCMILYFEDDQGTKKSIHVVLVCKCKFSFLLIPLHNVHFVKYDVTVSFMAQVLDTVAYFVSHVLVVDTVTYFDIFR